MAGGLGSRYDHRNNSQADGVSWGTAILLHVVKMFSGLGLEILFSVSVSEGCNQRIFGDGSDCANNLCQSQKVSGALALAKDILGEDFLLLTQILSLI